jgi:hypothetical protein
MTPGDRRWRSWLLIACALGFVLWFLECFNCTPLLPWCASTGFLVDVNPGGDAAQSGGKMSALPGRVIVSEVDKGGAAAQAGIRVGDGIDLRDISPGPDGASFSRAPRRFPAIA